jgi:hypothetical protein
MVEKFLEGNSRTDLISLKVMPLVWPLVLDAFYCLKFVFFTNEAQKSKLKSIQSPNCLEGRLVLCLPTPYPTVKCGYSEFVYDRRRTLPKFESKTALLRIFTYIFASKRKMAHLPSYKAIGNWIDVSITWLGMKTPLKKSIKKIKNQCCGTGSTCFWAIRIH